MGLARFDAIPAVSRRLRVELEDRLSKLREFSETCEFNFVEWNTDEIGIITSGVAYVYAKEVFGNKASYLKLGFTHPLPMNKIRDFAGKVKTLYVIEELEPYLERHLREAGIECIGKEKLPSIGELLPEIIAEKLLGRKNETIEFNREKLVPRPPTLCAGCPHRGFFYEIGKIKNIMIASDIGCYSLGGSAPLYAKDTCVCMGASAGTGHGAQRIFDLKGEGTRVVAVMGDSTFFHTGLNGVLNAIYNKSNLITCVLDNRTTAMTGHQDHPGTGFTASGDVTQEVSIEDVVRAFGCNNVRTINPHHLNEVRDAIKWALELDEPSVIVARYPCAVKKYTEADLKEFGPLTQKCYVDEEKCIGCKRCTKTGCPAIHFKPAKKKSSINEAMCVGCTVCAQVCPVKAIMVKE